MTNTHTAAQIERFRLATIAKAEELKAQYPQYANHWNGWRVVRITRAIRTKLGPAFGLNEWTIATVLEAEPRFDLPTRVVAFSLSNKIDTEIGDDAVEWLDGARPAAHAYGALVAGPK